MSKWLSRYPITARQFVYWFLICLSATSWANGGSGTVFKGRFVLNELHGIGIANVPISADAASPTMSLSDGSFKLVFKKEPGELFRLRVNHGDLAVVNHIQLEGYLPKPNSAYLPLTIILAKPNERQKWALRFYRIMIDEIIEQQYQHKLGQLTDRNSSQQDIEQKVRKLTEEKQKLQEQASMLAQSLSEHESPPQGLYKEAIQLYLSGDLDQALEVLNDAELEKQYQQHQFKKGQLEKQFRQLKLKEAELEAQSRQYQREEAAQANANLLKAIVYEQRFEAEKALAQYRTLVKRFPNHGHAQSTAARFFSTHNYTKDAQQSYDKALNIYRAKAKEDPQVHLPNVATILNGLGRLQSHQLKPDEAERSYNEALEIYRTLASQAPSLKKMAEDGVTLAQPQMSAQGNSPSSGFDHAVLNFPSEDSLRGISMVLSNLGTLQVRLGKHDRAEQSLTEALSINRRLAEHSPERYKPSIAAVLNGLGHMQEAEGHFSEAAKYYQEVIDIFREYAKQEPDLYLSALSGALQNLGGIMFKIHQLDEAEKKFVEAIEIRKTLVSKAPRSVLPNIASAYSNLGILYSKKNELAKAQESYLEALKAYSILDEDALPFYLPDMGKVHHNLGVLYYQQNALQDAVRSHEAALQAYTRLNKKVRNNYVQELAISQFILGDLYSELDMYAQAEQTYQGALKEFRTLEAIFSRPIKPSLVAEVQSKIADLQSKQEKWALAEVSYEATLRTRRQLALSEPDTYLPRVASTLYNLGVINYQQANYAKAKPYAQESMEIRKRLSETHAEQDDFQKSSHLMALIIKQQEQNESTN
ncbi:hypothetical protein CBQ28_14600 [Pseudoalteromonas sp. GCY]|uniref:tetratricopeptide repeat protein n=1 Tax=Pseudoalteromonas sp. GCY TaxID=2003316 RepID=UPI000BFEE465|nr:tetratricopeptide repeat protein [Pseudoalteromonas sp. GCY]PHI36438.1 hypothetical protein CBQ28_14600 [Pseudoalteromonas sp. GCY]QQQ65407.1 tetratricopeptide repeat protein [Pseudoalteromonas sp. GCY]